MEVSDVFGSKICVSIHLKQPNEQLVAELNARGHPAIPLDLKRFDWLKITKSIPTKVVHSLHTRIPTTYPTHVSFSYGAAALTRPIPQHLPPKK